MPVLRPEPGILIFPLQVISYCEPYIYYMKFIPYLFVRSMKKMVQKFWVQGSGLWVQGSGFRVQGCGLWVQGSGLWVLGSGVLGSGLWVQGLSLRLRLRPHTQGSGLWVQGSGFRDSGLKVQRFGAQGSLLCPAGFPGQAGFESCNPVFMMFTLTDLEFPNYTFTSAWLFTKQ
jgi:hypothetical protein